MSIKTRADRRTPRPSGSPLPRLLGELPPLRGAGALGPGALPHPFLALLRAPAGALAIALGLAACGRSSSGAPAAPERDPAAEQRVEQLIEAFAPVDPTLTSDRQDAWLARQRELLEELGAAPPALGRAALEAFRRRSDLDERTRCALLEVAASSAPGATVPSLEELFGRYEAGLVVRTEAVRLLAECAPERTRVLVQPLLVATHHSATWPPRESLLRAWLEASRRLGAVDAGVLSEIALGLTQPPEVRYLAIAELGRTPGVLATKALEQALVESTSDGYVRIKAAQALQEKLEPAELCALLYRVADRESDQNFLLFLADMIEDVCP